MAGYIACFLRERPPAHPQSSPPPPSRGSSPSIALAMAPINPNSDATKPLPNSQNKLSRNFTTSCRATNAAEPLVDIAGVGGLCTRNPSPNTAARRKYPEAPPATGTPACAHLALNRSDENKKKSKVSSEERIPTEDDCSYGSMDSREFLFFALCGICTRLIAQSQWKK